MNFIFYKSKHKNLVYTFLITFSKKYNQQKGFRFKSLLRLMKETSQVCLQSSVCVVFFCSYCNGQIYEFYGQFYRLNWVNFIYSREVNVFSLPEIKTCNFNYFISKRNIGQLNIFTFAFYMHLFVFL